MADPSKNDLPNVNIGGDVVDSNIVIGNNNVVTNVKNFLFRDTKQLAIVIIVLLLVTGGIAFGVWYSMQPRKMTGNFNIAVAQFGEISADGSIRSSARAEKISSTLFNFLDSEYRASGLGLSIQVAHKNMPLITEDRQAEELAKKVDADIVIYGNIYVQGDQAEFSPRFYVDQRADANELTGQNELAFPIQFDLSQLGSQDQVNSELRIRTEILFNFTKSLIYFSQKNPVPALNSVLTAIASAEKSPKPFGGQEALYLFAARIQMSQGKNTEANSMLDKALSLNPGYARAHLARGNMYYSQSIQNNFDLTLLDMALAEYTQAYELPNQPDSAYIPVKAHTALGNAWVIKAQMSNDPRSYSEAITHFKFVTDEYARTKDPFVRSYASIAYFGWGAASERQGQKDSALKAYRQAYDLTDDNEFKTRIQKQIEAVQSK